MAIDRIPLLFWLHNLPILLFLEKPLVEISSCKTLYLNCIKIWDLKKKQLDIIHTMGDLHLLLLDLMSTTIMTVFMKLLYQYFVFSMKIKWEIKFYAPSNIKMPKILRCWVYRQVKSLAQLQASGRFILILTVNYAYCWRNYSDCEM